LLGSVDLGPEPGFGGGFLGIAVDQADGNALACQTDLHAVELQGFRQRIVVTDEFALECDEPFGDVGVGRGKNDQAWAGQQRVFGVVPEVLVVGHEVAAKFTRSAYGRERCEKIVRGGGRRALPGHAAFQRSPHADCRHLAGLL
jgi:hypothetical protein